MKLSEIKKLLDEKKTVYVKGKGNVKSIVEKDGKFTVKYEVPSKAKFYGRLTSC